MLAGEKNINILPNADKVIIPEIKLTKYALNAKDGDPNKAAAFKLALGYDLTNYRLLIENIRKNVKNFNAVEKPDLGYGRRFEVMITLTGANGKTANVLTAWIVDKDTYQTRLTSLYVTKKKRRRG